MQEQCSKQCAQNFVKRLTDKILLSTDEKELLVIAFKNFYDELQIYLSAGNIEIVKVLSYTRDATVSHILADDQKYVVYQKYMESLSLKGEKHQDGDNVMEDVCALKLNCCN